MSLKDERLHAVGFAQIEKIGDASNDSEFIKVTISFRGGVSVALDVPKKTVYPAGSSSPFAERQMVYVDFEINCKPIVKTFNGNSYAVNDISTGRIVEFRTLTKEEKA